MAGVIAMNELFNFILALLAIIGPLVLVWLIVEVQCGQTWITRKNRLPRPR
jgi:hypothetical protein